MQLFDFHHHNKNYTGVYNAEKMEIPEDFLFSAGIHPNDADNNVPDLLEWIRESAQKKNCFAIGECGLDSTVSVSHQIQTDVYKAQIEIANEFRKPVILHCVRRFPEIMACKKYSQVPMIVHGFSKKKEIADQLVNNGFYLSFGKALLSNLSLQEIFRVIPVDRFFLETDSAEVNLEEIYSKAAEIKSCTIAELNCHIANNLKKITEI